MKICDAGRLFLAFSEPVALIRCLLVLLLFSAPVPGMGQLLSPGVFISRSVSGQFTIQSAPDSFGSPLVSLMENDTNYLHLDPALLTVSCERIRQLVWRQLSINGGWKGKVFIRLYPANSPDDQLFIDSELFRDGWQYRVGLPNICQKERFLRAMVTVVLLEIADRDAREHNSEVPAWLAEGLSREIWCSNQRDVILPAPQFSSSGLRLTTFMLNARIENPLEAAHAQLSKATPLTFQQLSWPATDPQTGETEELFRSCAQVFVHALLNLPNGPANLAKFLGTLHNFYNWQFAFTDAFQDQFHQILDVEKWWTLQMVHFTGRELGENWSAEESWQKLDECVRSAVHVRIGTNELPLHAEVPLQAIVRDWPTPNQTMVLQRKAQELQALAPRLSRDLTLLATEYVQVIAGYLQQMNHSGFVLPFRKKAQLRHHADDVVRRLDQLDARKAELKPPKQPEPETAPIKTITAR